MIFHGLSSWSSWCAPPEFHSTVRQHLRSRVLSSLKVVACRQVLMPLILNVFALWTADSFLQALISWSHVQRMHFVDHQGDELLH